LKATERNKIRTQSSQEETKRSDILNAFINEFHRFKSVSSQIEKFIKSNKLLDLKSLETVLSSIVKQIMESETELNDLTPEVEEMKAKVQDKEAKQDNIVRNLELLDMIAGQLKLEDEQFLLQDKMNKLDVDSIIGQLNDAKKKVDNYKSEIDRRLGSKDSLEIQQRELKVRNPSTC
jgi:chromosome segregation ATPase